MSPFQRLWLAQFVSSLGDFVAVFAVQTAVTFRMHGAPRDVTGIFVAGLLPPLLLSPFTGTLADRWNPRRVLIAADLARAFLVLGLVRASGIPKIWAVSFALGCASSFFQPAMSILVPAAVARGDLATAYARLQQSLQIARIAGPVMAAALARRLGESACYYLDSGSFLLSAALLATFRLSHPRPASVSTRWTAGIRFLARDRDIASFLLVLAAATFAGSCFGALASFYVRDTLHAGTGSLAAMSALIGAGTVAGASLARRICARARDPLVPVRGGLAAVAVSTLALAELADASIAFAASFVMGAGVGIVVVASATLLQGRTPPGLRGRISGISSSLTATAQLSALLLSGALASRIGTTGVLVLSAGILFGTMRVLAFTRSSPPELIALHCTSDCESAPLAMQARDGKWDPKERKEAIRS